MIEHGDRRYDFRVIELALIDPPQHAMRDQMKPVELEKLADSIKRSGILQPLGVYRDGDRYRISWGHRRYVAAGIAGETHVPCRVLFDGSVREEEFKLTENRFREDVNPAAEAAWLADLLERKCDHDIGKLMDLTGATENWLNGRLDLLRGFDDVYQALLARQITLAVARELNKVRNDTYRGLFLSDAIRDGSTSSAIRKRRQDLEQTLKFNELMDAADGGQVSTFHAASIVTVDACGLCLRTDDQQEMELMKVHRSCRVVLERNMRSSAPGPGGPS